MEEKVCTIPLEVPPFHHQLLARLIYFARPVTGDQRLDLCSGESQIKCRVFSFNSENFTINGVWWKILHPSLELPRWWPVDDYFHTREQRNIFTTMFANIFAAAYFRNYFQTWEQCKIYVPGNHSGRKYVPTLLIVMARLIIIHSCRV